MCEPESLSHQTSDMLSSCKKTDVEKLLEEAKKWITSQAKWQGTISSICEQLAEAMGGKWTHWQISKHFDPVLNAGAEMAKQAGIKATNAQSSLWVLKIHPHNR